jgi:hypothetical protein
MLPFLDAAILPGPTHLTTGSVPAPAGSRNVPATLYNRKMMRLPVPFFLMPSKCPFDAARVDRDAEPSLDDI